MIGYEKKPLDKANFIVHTLTVREQEMATEVAQKRRDFHRGYGSQRHWDDKEKGEYAEAVSETIFTTGKAIISTGIILALGFFVLYFSTFVPNHEFGLLATIIIVTAACASLILLPVLILQVKPVLRLNK